MNRAHWKEMLPIIQALVDGKDVLIRETIGDINGFSFTSDPSDYKIVEPVNKWLKTGWVKNKDSGACRMITGFHKQSIEMYLIGQAWFSEEHIENHYTPCESPIGDNNE